MDKTIVITGAGVGLGRALARRFAADGENVVLLGRTLSKVEAVAEELSHRGLAIECDVSSPDSVRAAFAKIAEQHPRIDVLINNAAIFEPFLITEATDEQIMNALATNLAGPMLCTRAAVPMMTRGSHIINVTSEAVDVPLPHLSVYQSSKAGLECFSTTMFRELEPAGIRVSTVRAGQMHEEGKTWDVDPGASLKFHKAALEVGINLAERPISQFTSVTTVFRTLVDLPPDLSILHMELTARAWD